MAWGYEKSFVVEHDQTLKRRICCKDCTYYEKDDKSCNKRGLYLPEDGFDSWKKCQYFDMLSDVSHVDEKSAQLERHIKNLEKQKEEKKKGATKGTNKSSSAQRKDLDSIKTSKTAHSTRASSASKESSTQATADLPLKAYQLIVLKNGLPSGLRYKTITVTKRGMPQEKVRVGLNSFNRRAYVAGNLYSAGTIEAIKILFR